MGPAGGDYPRMQDLPVQFVEANGIRHAYVEEGEGPLVLMFHGFPDTPHTWDVIRPAVAAAGFRVVTPWLRGYAPSGIPEHDTDPMTQGKDVLALVNALGDGPACVVGHDWGASLVYAAAALEPQKIRKLVAMAIPPPAAILPTPKILWGVRHFVTYRLPGAVERFAKGDYADIEVMFKRWSPTWNYGPSDVEPVKEAFRQPGCLDAALGYYRGIPLVPPAWLKNARLTMPTLVFAGKDDPIIGPSAFERGRRVTDSTYEVAAVSGGHFMHRESPDEVLAHLIPFLRA